MNEPSSIKPFQVGIAGAIGGLVAVAVVGLTVSLTPKGLKLEVARALHLVSGTTNSPIKVRGGAMTFYTKAGGSRPKNYGWYQLNPTTWCTSVDASSIYGEGLDGVNDGPISTTFPWVMRIYAHDHDDYSGNSRDDEGVQLAYQTKDCSNASNATSVLLTFFGNSDLKLKLYDNDLPNVGSYTSNKRFQSTDVNCSKDQDLCERMAKVEICIPPSDMTTACFPPPGSHVKPAPIRPYLCRGGDCTLRVGDE